MLISMDPVDRYPWILKPTIVVAGVAIMAACLVALSIMLIGITATYMFDRLTGRHLLAPPKGV
jgi:hypothetical protein